jgi:hypothetical protein
MTEATPRPDGIYFGLDEQEYHDDPALGSTDLKHLLQSPSDFWWGSWMNPLREEIVSRETSAKLWGSAFHCMILDGEKVFNQTYAVQPDQDDYKDLLVTADDLKQHLRNNDKKVSGAKAALIERIREFDPDVPIWDEILDEHATECEMFDLTSIPKAMYQELQLTAAMITKNPHLESAFTNGYPEVSVFWEQDGIRVKARIDYLKIKSVVDLKTFRNFRQTTFDRAIFNSIASFRYDIQAAHYLRARREMVEFIRDGLVYGDKQPPKPWLEALAAEEEHPFIWVFVQAAGAPISKGFLWDEGTVIHDFAENEIDIALDRYKEYSQKFGEEIWVLDEPVHRIAGEDLPVWYGQG